MCACALSSTHADIKTLRRAHCVTRAVHASQDQERQLLQRGFDVLQSLEQERVSQLAAAGTALAAAYASAVAGLPAAADSLRGMLQGLGGAGEAGLAHLAQVAAGARAAAKACCVGRRAAAAAAALLWR